jgi:hypothetical protein
MPHLQSLEEIHQGEVLVVLHQAVKKEMNGIQDVKLVEEEHYPYLMMGLLEVQNNPDLLLHKGKIFKVNGTIETGHEVELLDQQHETKKEVAMDETVEIGEMILVEMAVTIVDEIRRGREVVVEWRTKEIQVKTRDRDEMTARGPKST